MVCQPVALRSLAGNAHELGIVTDELCIIPPQVGPRGEGIRYESQDIGTNLDDVLSAELDNERDCPRHIQIRPQNLAQCLLPQFPIAVPRHPAGDDEQLRCGEVTFPLPTRPVIAVPVRNSYYFPLNVDAWVKTNVIVSVLDQYSARPKLRRASAPIATFASARADSGIASSNIGSTNDEATIQLFNHQATKP